MKWICTAALLTFGVAQAAAQQAVPEIKFEANIEPLKLPANMHFGEVVGGEEGCCIFDRTFFQLGIEDFEIERKVLDAAFAELDVGVADFLRDDGCVAAGDFEHVV